MNSNQPLQPATDFASRLSEQLLGFWIPDRYTIHELFEYLLTSLPYPAYHPGVTQSACEDPLLPAPGHLQAPDAYFSA
jgi:hypothetical protein